MAQYTKYTFPARVQTPRCIMNAAYAYDLWDADHIECMTAAHDWIKRQYEPRGAHDRTPKPICDEFIAMTWAIHAENVIAITGGFND